MAPRVIALRWLASYVMLWCLPFPIGAVPKTDWLEDKYFELWNATVQKIGIHLLGLPESVGLYEDGSGDSIGAYARLVAIIIFATLVTVAWTTIDRRRERDEQLSRVLRVYVRYFLGTTMLTYGVHKIFNLQFVGGRTSSRMLETYGESSPFAIVWTFMGASTPYTVFSGLAEALGGALLFFRRSTTIGLLVLLPVVSNVVLLNFCYDIGVKLESAHLLLMAVCLVAPDMRRLASVALGGAAEAVPPRIVVSSKRERVGRIAVKSAFILSIVAGSILLNVEILGRLRTRHALFGAYEVESESTPKAVRTVMVDELKVFAMRRDDGTLQRFRIDKASTADSLTLRPFRNRAVKWQLSYQHPDEEHLTLEGRIDDEPVALHLRKTAMPSFLLKTRGFHWVDDYPFDP